MMTTPPTDKGMFLYLALTALTCGASIMIIEVLGSRVVGPFFGVSLFVWTSLITVTLIALAAGYAVGGVIADRHSTPEYLYLIIFVAGLLTLAIPFLKAPILKASMALGLRTGSFCSTLVLFGPALFSLGCVSPFIVRLATREVSRIGRTVGGFYALSTVGSVIGTAATGFFLIPHMGVDRIFIALAFLLMLLSAVYFAAFRRRWLALAVLALPLFLPPEAVPASRIMENGTQVQQLAGRETFYGSIKVVDYRYRDNWTRELIIDGLIQGGIDPRNGLSVYEYSYFISNLPFALNPGGNRGLVIGLGAGIVPRAFAERGVVTDIVEIDPVVVEIAKTHFGFQSNGRVFIADARQFLTVSDDAYDYIVLDVFSGDITPGYLLSVEAMKLVRNRMAADGVLAINLVGSLRKRNLMTASVIRTISSVFDQVQVHPTFDPGRGDGVGNLVVLAYNGPRRDFDTAAVGTLRVHPLAAKDTRENFWHEYVIPPEPKSIILTDDFNPMDAHDAWLREQVREGILQSTDWGILLGSRS